MIYDQARGRSLPAFRHGRIARVASAFSIGRDALTIFAEDSQGHSQAVSQIESALN